VKYIPTWIVRIFLFEYWPWQLFYVPLYFYMFWLGLKDKCMFAFTATNPGISENSGLYGASKSGIMSMIPDEYKPTEIVFDEDSSEHEILRTLESSSLNYPVIAKPNEGERGYHVAKIMSEKELKKYINESESAIILQEFITHPLEFNVAFFIHPKTKEVDVTSVTSKEFLHVTGDGKSTVKKLLKNNIRARMAMDSLEYYYPDKMNVVVPEGEIFVVEPIGNHSRGTRFYDKRCFLKDGRMKNVISNIVRDLDGVHFGRVDFKANSENDLYTGQDIKVFELNGIHAEPTHMFDTQTNVFGAYKDLFFQWKKIHNYGVINYDNGIPKLRFKDFVSSLSAHYKLRREHARTKYSTT
jgi:hypothetical protein